MTDQPDTPDVVGTEPPPPPPPPQPAPRRLVRNPYSRLGGVASGVATYYGVDVSIVRILFLLLAFGTGFGFLVYLLAWIIIPRADHWPPGGATPRPFRSLTRRDLGLGLAGIGLVVALAIGGGATGSILIPLVLVGGGVWLLIQPAAEIDRPIVEPAGFVANPPGPAMPPGPAVPPRSRRRRGLVIGLIAAAAVFVLIPLLIIGGIVIAVVTGNFTDDVVTVSYAPDSVAEFPLDVNLDAAEVTIDLTGLDVDDFDGATAPAEIDVNVDFGEITVIVPEDLPVSVDADTTVGDVDVFDRSASGIGNRASADVNDPVVDIEIDLGFGKVSVVRP